MGKRQDSRNKIQELRFKKEQVRNITKIKKFIFFRLKF